MTGLLQDIRYALRQMRKSPTFSLAVIATLALGIGLNTSLFSVFDALIMRPLPFKDAAAIVNVYQAVHNDPGQYRPFSYPEYVALQDSNDAFSGLAAYSWTTAELSRNDPDNGSPVHGLLVSGNYFSVLGGKTTIGRTFLPEEASASRAQPLVVLSHAFWQGHFNSDKTLIGRTIALNGVQFTVIGVAAPQFAGTEPQIPDFWAPIGMQAQLQPSNPLLNERNSYWLQLFARLNIGVSLNQAQAKMSALLHGLAPEYLGASGRSTILLTPGTFLSRPDERTQIISNAFLALVAVSIVLLIACVNVAGLILARATTRRAEIGVRLSLGASRSRLIQQLLTENLLLALLSGGIGLLLAWYLPHLLVRILQPPHEQPLFLTAGLDARILLYTVLLSTMTGLAVGLAPALQASKSDLLSWLRDDTRRFGFRLTRSRLHRILVVAETSACLVLLMASGLLVRALHKAQKIDLGFNASHVLTVSLNLGAHGYDNVHAAEFDRRFTERLQSLPGVKSVSIASLPPLGGISRAGAVTVNGHNQSSDSSRFMDYWVVSPQYFETLQIPILKGHGFTPEDTRKGSTAAIINEAMARELWPGEDPIGKYFRLGPPSAPFTQVVGVVQNTRGARLWEEDKPYVYLPLLETTQGPAIQTGQLGMQFLIRTEGEPEVVAAMLPQIVKSLDPNVRVSASPLEHSLGRWLWFSRIGALLASVLGFLALLLATIGIYGVMSYSIAQRTREIGIRMALGADRNSMRRLVLKEGLRLSLLAVAIGVVIALPAMHVMTGILYGLEPTDPVTFVSVSLLLSVVAMLACYIPARRAAKVDPMVALRYE